MQWWESALLIIGIVLVLFVILKLFKVSFKIIWKLIVNALVGGIVLWLLNLNPREEMPINWLTTILTGLFGIPAVIVIFIVSLIR